MVEDYYTIGSEVSFFCTQKYLLAFTSFSATHHSANFGLLKTTLVLIRGSFVGFLYRESAKTGIVSYLKEEPPPSFGLPL